MTECTNHRPWDTETPSHKISHDEYYEKWGRPIKQSISRACSNHAFSIHKSQHSPPSCKKICECEFENKNREIQNN